MAWYMRPSSRLLVIHSVNFRTRQNQRRLPNSHTETSAERIGIGVSFLILKFVKQSGWSRSALAYLKVPTYTNTVAAAERRTSSRDEMYEKSAVLPPASPNQAGTLPQSALPTQCSLSAVLSQRSAVEIVAVDAVQPSAGDLTAPRTHLSVLKHRRFFAVWARRVLKHAFCSDAGLLSGKSRLTNGCSPGTDTLVRSQTCLRVRYKCVPGRRRADQS